MTNKRNKTMTALQEAVDEIVMTETEGLLYEDKKHWLENLARNGCVSGHVSALTYYSDTTAFFDEHEEEILALAQDNEFDVSVVERGITGFKNEMAWFAFERLAHECFEDDSEDNYTNEYADETTWCHAKSGVK